MIENAKERFSSRAKVYSQARPGYPQETVEYICRRFGLGADSKIADIGAGTGISSRAFAAAGMQVLALEPNAAMLEEARLIPEYRDRISFLQVGAEDTGLPAGTIDAIISAQAFHWFDPQKALSEFRRILKPSAGLALIWNERDESDPFTRAYGDLLRTLPDTAGVELKRGVAGQALLDSQEFCGQERVSFVNRQLLDLDALKARAFSASYVPEAGSEAGLHFEKSLEELYARFRETEALGLKYECSVYLGFRT